jgi:hypothetical protein
MILFVLHVFAQIVMCFTDWRRDVKKEFYAFATMDALVYVLSGTTDLYKHNIGVQTYHLYVCPFMVILFMLFLCSVLVTESYFLMCDKVQELFNELFEAYVARNTRAAAAAAA